MSGLGEIIALVIIPLALLGPVIPLVILYFVIKLAIRNAVIELRNDGML